MIFFLMFFLSTLNTTRLEENDNEHNPSIKNLKNRKYLDETMDLDQKDDQSIKNQYENEKYGISQTIDKNITLFDYYQNINQNKLLLNMESTNNEEKEIDHNENDSTNDDISNSLCGNNQNYENLETNYYENQFIRDIEEFLANDYIWDPEIYYEQNFMPSEINYNVQTDSSMTYDEKMIQEHPGDAHALLQANQNKTTIPRNISSGRQIENQSEYLTINPKIGNETKKNPHVPSSKTSYNQQKSIPDINTQRYHDIDDRESIWTSDIDLDDSNLTEIPDLIAYKEYLENLSIQNNFISCITENITGFTCLKKLNLSRNIINSIECKMENTKLEWLNLSYNRLTYAICECIFSMTTLKYLNLQNNVIELIGKINSMGLIILNMKNNLITDIPESIAELKFLKKLNLSYNRINNINYKIKNTNLEWLNLSYNRLTYAICECIFSMTTLKYLNLQNNVIELIGKINSMGLIILNMKNNLITDIPESITKLKFLKKLDLSHNRINNINYKIKNINLEWFDLSNNRLTYSSTVYIFAITTLKYLNLENNVIEFIEWFNSQELIILNMKNNLITDIPESITKLKFLKKLDLSHNRINNINYKIKNINLEWVDLSYNCLNHKNGKFIFGITTLKYLNLENNLIGRIKRFNSQELIILNMKNNCITSIPRSIAKLKFLKILNLSHNRINKINYKIKSSNLEWFDLSYNRLTYAICECIFSMTTLKYLNLQNNVIEMIGKINSMELIILNMKNNLITDIPESIAELKFLKKLNLSYNRINNINYKMENTNLEWFDLSYNCLTYYITVSIYAMTTLKHLNLENNVIGCIKRFNSTGLIILNMKNNLIGYIPGSISELTCLKRLDLSHNRINRINYKIKSSNLEWLDLSYNCLTYVGCKSIFEMTTLKHLNLENNYIEFIEGFNSTGLIILNISTNPINEIRGSFYELPNIRQLFMSNLKTKEPICFSKVLPNLKVLDISHNQFIFSIYNIEVLYLLDEVNLSNCGLTNCPISSEMINIKNLILFQNNLEALPIDFGKLRNNIEILDLRKNPLRIFSTEDYLGALDILACYYGKVLMDEYIIQNIQELSFDEISFKKYKKEWVYFTKFRKNQINGEFFQNIVRVIAYTGNEEIRKEAYEVITLVKEIRDSGFIDFEKTIEEVIKIIKENQYENICIKNILDYLNTKFSSKFYKFLDDILYSYKIRCLKSTLNHIYNSDEHLNYWIYHLSDILSFIGIVEVKKNYQIHNYRNIILNCFIDIMDLNVLVNIIELELEKDEEMMGIFNILLDNDQEQSRKRLLDGTLKKEKTVEKNCVKYILKIYQIIDEFQ